MKLKKTFITILIVAILIAVGVSTVSARGFGKRDPRPQTTPQTGWKETRDPRGMMPGMRGRMRDSIDEMRGGYQVNQEELFLLIDQYVSEGKLTAAEGDSLKADGRDVATAQFELLDRLIDEGVLDIQDVVALRRIRFASDEERAELLTQLIDDGKLSEADAALLAENPRDAYEKRSALIEQLVEAGKLTADEAERLDEVCAHDSSILGRMRSYLRGRNRSFNGADCPFCGVAADEADDAD